MLDVLLGIGVLAIFIGFAGASLLFSQRAPIKSGDRIRAVFLSRQAVEAVRSMRDADFDSIQEGTFGVEIGEEGRWEFSGSETVHEDGFVTNVEVSLSDEDHASVTAATRWSMGPHRFGTASLTTQLANWRQVRETGNWSFVLLAGSYIDEATPMFNAIALSGEYAFVTSETSAGGAGLYVFDISNLSLPARVADGFSLGADGYQLAAGGDVLFVLTSSPGSEVRAYDISSPEILSADNFLGSYNIPGEGRARSIALFENVLFVGADESVDEHEFFSLDVSNPADITLLDSYDDEGGYLDLSLHDGYAYIASSKDVSELIVADVFDPSDIQIAAGSGYNLTDVLDGRAIKAFGTYVLIGRAYGDVTQELVLFDIEDSPVPTPPPGPWYHGIGADVNAMDVDPTGTYAFVASDFDEQEFQVIDIALFAQGQLPRVAGFNTDTGAGRWVTYDLLRDRVFLVTNTALLIFAPAS